MTKKLTPLAISEESTVVFEYQPQKDAETSYQSEAQLEKEFIALLQKQGYEYKRFTSQNALKENLKDQLQKLNNFTFSPKEWEDFYKSVIADQKDGIKGKARKIQEDPIHTLRLENGETRNIKLIDKKNIHNNILQITNQYTAHAPNRTNRYDVTILVNGLPLVHIELKRRGVAIREAFNQIKRYARESFGAEEGLFEYVQIFVISNGTQTKYYSNTTREKATQASQGQNTTKRTKNDTFEFTSYWADSQNKVILDLMDFAKTFFARHSLLNILTRYCVFTSDEDLLVMRPYQIVATERILQKIHIAHNAKTYGTPRNGGYIWHTTGSGKTLTSFKTAQLAMGLEFISKVLFVVDRKDLDYQTMKEYDKFQKDSANSNANTKILRQQLTNPEARIIITTIQKLDKFIKTKDKSEAEKRVLESEVAIIFDECHRSQFGSMHQSIIKAFKKYYLFGFTGTPIFAENCDKNSPQDTTEHRFGEALHKYTIIDAIADKNVLPFNVLYHNTTKYKDSTKNKSATATERVLLDEERILQITNYIIEHFARLTKHDETYTLNKLENIQSVAKNRQKIQEKRSSATIKGFNSILACASIEAAKKYYQAFKEAKHSLKIATIYSYAPNEAIDGLDEENNEDTDALDKSSRDFLENAIKDYNETFSTNYDTSAQSFQSYYKDVSLRVKNREIDILIVANMFLTGFDATTLNTLWVDKNLKYHGLIQAFSRTNRILNSIKTFGNIVCFRDLEENLNKSLALFGNKDSKGTILLRSFEDYYHGYSQDGKEIQGYKTLIEKLQNDFPLHQRITSEEKQKEFISLYGQILKTRNILECFVDDFTQDKELIPPRSLQDYQGMYLDLYKELQEQAKMQKESIRDEVVFEIELIKQVEVNIDYILSLIQDYAKSQDKETKDKIESGINSSLEMRNKKDLIMNFVDSINIPNEDIIKDFEAYITQKRQEEFEAIIQTHKLNAQETYDFVKKAFKYGGMDFKGTEFPKILPKESSSFFSKTSNRSQTKEKIAEVLQGFFDRFFTISSNDFGQEG